ncbi:MAG: 16S rRNA (cytidine(1402)-2'-O)-methyltransferase [Erysipelotrichaceae bacterium]|nr:16S rRNA (cytidine(1402)-2'-O)-methyltransferase [Erysipelotrichaceae bacterium]
MRNRNFDENLHILYLIPTPIGNLEEMNPRAINILKSVLAIGCEDTRVSKQLLANFGISNKLISCHEHNEEMASEELLKYLETGNIAYVSDAGYPGISDPGHRLVVKALENGFKVSVISGPNAMLNALVGSGLDTSHFYFHGFLASKQSARLKELEDLKHKKETMIFYESPHRITDTLLDLKDVLGNRKACIARELTKRFEEFIREDLNTLASLDANTLKGEMVIVVDGEKEDKQINLDVVLSYAKELIKNGVNTKLAAKLASEKYNVSKNVIYNAIIKGE